MIQDTRVYSGTPDTPSFFLSSSLLWDHPGTLGTIVLYTITRCTTYHWFVQPVCTETWVYTGTCACIPVYTGYLCLSFWQFDNQQKQKQFALGRCMGVLFMYTPLQQRLVEPRAHLAPPTPKKKFCLTHTCIYLQVLVLLHLVVLFIYLFGCCSLSVVCGEVVVERCLWTTATKKWPCARLDRGKCLPEKKILHLLL